LTATIAFAGEIELALGNPAAAVEHLERACSDWEHMGERGIRSTFQARLAEAQYELGRFDEAERNVQLAAELGASDDLVTRMAWQGVEAKLQARRGEHVEAERIAREAVAIVDRSQMLNQQADAYAGLAEVLELAGKTDAARDALEQALERYERKENLVGAERARARLAELSESCSSGQLV
jgi:tetratricopeptide (TPR) repeat protein